MDRLAEPTVAPGAGQRPKLAVVLFNLGGPDKLESVRPFLINLFTDPAILRVPAFVRPFLSRLIAWRRVKPATENYRLLGGRSPLLDLTLDQARALQAELPDHEARCFVAMRYWHPFSRETVQAVKNWAPDEIVLLPLYPHFSTTTTGSSVTDWNHAADRAGLDVPTRLICCYPEDSGFVGATAALLRQTLDHTLADLHDRQPGTGLRVLFSAHGLPQVIVDQGDPYQYQIETTSRLVAERLAVPGLDWRVCYQSRATPQRWLEPSIEQELRRAAEDRVAVLVVPIAFVSDHSETLVELDIEYRDLAHELGIPGYYRAPTQNSDPGFITALARLIRERRETCGHRACPQRFGACPFPATSAVMMSR
jgi:ferrochelatase